MHNGAVAEWIVSRFLNKDRAGAIIGDLLELRPQKGALWFWLSLIGIVLSQTWRPMVAFLGAYYTALAVTDGFMTIQNPTGHLWVSLFLALLICAAMAQVLWIALVYSAIRYSFRGRFIQATLLFILAGSSIAYDWRHPAVLAIYSVFSILLAYTLIRIHDFRKVLQAYLAAIRTPHSRGMDAVLIVCSLISLALVTPSISGHHSPLLAKYWRDYGMPFLITWLTTKGCARAYERLIKDNSSGSEPA